MTRSDVSSIQMSVGSWGKIRGYATVTFTNGLTVNGFKVIQGNKGFFVGMPSVQRKNKETQQLEWKDVMFFEDEEDRKAFQDIILSVYNEKTGASGEESGLSPDDEGASFF